MKRDSFPSTVVRIWVRECAATWETLAGDGNVTRSWSTGKDTLSMLSDSTRLTERFTRIDDKTLRYEATIDDPRTFTRRWTVSFPLKQDPSYYLFEYACHEGNLVNMRAMLAAARLADK
jgi:hypothetical protein